MLESKQQFAPYAQSPLHPFGLPVRARVQDGSCGVWMNELPLLGYIVLRGDPQEPGFAGATLGVLGYALPVAPGTFLTFAHGVVLWQAPDEWLVVCARTAYSACLAALDAALAGVHAQVVDNAGGLTTVYVSGDQHVQLLRHVSVYDIESVTPGRAVSTVCGKAGMIVYRYDAQGIFVVFRRSFADYVWRLLEKSARPYRLGISAIAAQPGHPVLRLI